MIARYSLRGLVLVAVLLVPILSIAAEDPCQAALVGTLKRVESKETKMVYTAQVDVTVEKRCADVSFDLVVVEEISGGEQNEVRVSKTVRVRDSVTTSVKVDYSLPEGRTIASHRFEQTSCQLCE